VEPTRRLSGVLFAVSLALTVAGLLLVFSALSTAQPSRGIGFPGFPAVFAVSFSTVGWLVTVRQPKNPLGWLFTVVGVIAAILVFAQGYALLGVIADPGALPGAVWAAWIYSWLWFPMAALAGFFILLLFPDGRVPSPRWRPVAWFGVLVTTVFTVLFAFGPGPLSGFATVQNPAAIDLLSTDRFVASVAFLTTVTVMFLVSAFSLVLRFRRSTGIARQQLKWIAFAGGLFALLIIPTSLTISSHAPLAKVLQTVTLLSIAGIPVAAGIAILRYRLYEIDLLINRAVLYGGVTVALAAVLGVAYLVLQQLVETVTGQRSELVTIGLVALAAIAYGPVRRRAAPLVDRLLPARAVVSLLFTDIVESTTRLVQLGDERWRALLDRYRAAVRADLARHGGREVNTAGDAFFAVFDRPLAAVQCASAIHASVHRLELECRTGLHLGEVELRGEQVSGLAVHAAARVMAKAEPGEILVSEPLRAAVADGLQLVDRGQHELKGLPGEWQLYSIAGDGGH
jgi:class 3 adenylate cyclase